MDSNSILLCNLENVAWLYICLVKQAVVDYVDIEEQVVVVPTWHICGCSTSHSPRETRKDHNTTETS